MNSLIVLNPNSTNILKNIKTDSKARTFATSNKSSYFYTPWPKALHWSPLLLLLPPMRSPSKSICLLQPNSLLPPRLWQSMTSSLLSKLTISISSKSKSSFANPISSEKWMDFRKNQLKSICPNISININTNSTPLPIRWMMISSKNMFLLWASSNPFFWLSQMLIVMDEF